MLPNQPFSEFTLINLDQDLIYDTRLSNICHYGDFPLNNYGNIKHQPQPIPYSGSYLCEILEHVHKIMPKFIFNSVLITKYTNGADFIDFHSGNEP